MTPIQFLLNDSQITEYSVSPTITLLEYLRQNLGLTGTKEGCAVGDCGACTVAVADPAAPGGPAFRAVNSCLMLLPMVHGKRIYTVEALGSGGEYHTVQERLVEHNGSQCGYCTPGIVMSMFEACYRRDLDDPRKIDDQMCGNLCRCTGYRSIRRAVDAIAGSCPNDRFARVLEHAEAASPHLSYAYEDKRYLVPDTLADLFQILDRHPDARVVAGGTDVCIDITGRAEHVSTLVSLEGIAELGRLSRTDEGWRIGAMVKLTDLAATLGQTIPAIERALRFFGTRQVKHRATVGGNLCTASRIGDLAPLFLCLNARFRLVTGTGQRTLAGDEFFRDSRKTALLPGEIVESVEIAAIPEQEDIHAAFYKVSKRRECDMSTVTAGCYLHLDHDGVVRDVRLAFAGMAPVAKRARFVEQRLLGRAWTEQAVEDAVLGLEEDFTPVDDHRGSAWYRLTVAANLIRGFHSEAAEARATGLPRPTTGAVTAEGEQ